MKQEKSHTQGEKTEKSSPPSSYESSGYFSKLFCLYVFPFLYRYYRKDFDLNAIEENAKSHSCELLGQQFKKKWEHEVARHRMGKSASILRALFKTFWATYIHMNFWNFMVYGVFRMVMPILLGRIIYYSNLYHEQKIDETINSTISLPFTVQSPKTNLIENLLQLTNRQYVIFFSVILGILVLLNILVSHPYFMLKWRLGMRIRIALSRLIYEKSLKVTTETVQRTTVGKITNLVSNDAARFDSVFIYSEFLYMSLLEAPVAMIFLYFYIGRSSFGALAIVLLYIPFQTAMANFLSKLRSASIGLTDNRLRLMAEILPAMRVIKMYCWEKSFAKLVHIARKLEITKIRHSMMFRSLNLALFFVSSKVIAFVCILIFIFDGGELNAEVVFVSLALINQIKDVVAYQLPQAVVFSTDTYISLKRIEKFLLELDLTEEHKQLTRNVEEPSSVSSQTKVASKITLDKVSVNINDIPVIKNISFETVPGKLTVIIGAVGSGKSSVLLSILNELPILPHSTIKTCGKMTYVSQEAWIFGPATVRDNILFGREFDPVRYDEVVKVAALRKDFQQFEDGDQTMVDDRGTSLSGGQRARISLARALYTDSDCYLLDSPLSAVDSSVAKHIFEKCIKEYLKPKCVILVTHQLQFIKQADQIVVMKDGACLACGTYIDLLNKGIDLFRFTATAVQDPQTETSPEGSPSSRRLSIRRRIESFTEMRSRASSYIESDHESLYDDVSIFDYAHTADNRVRSNQPTSLELTSSSQRTANSGPKKSVFWIYYVYFSHGAGILLFSVFVSSNVITQIIFTGTDYWLAAWTGYQEQLHINATDPNFEINRSPIIAAEMNTNIIIYSIIVVVLFCFSIVRTVTFFSICMRASTKLHNRIFSSLIEAPIRFFDGTPIGIIMNRVSRDLGIIDDLLPSTGFESLEILGNSFGIFILCTALNYIIVLPLLIVLVVVYFAQMFYVDTARKLKRLEGMARSPLFNQLASSLSGLTTIRAYRSQEMFIDRFSTTQDRHTAVFFVFISASRIYGIFLELICLGFIYCLMVALNFQLDTFTGSIIGLTISQSLLLCNSFNWGVRQYTEVETMMTSVERLVEFGKLERESLDECIQEPSESWPQRGSIVYENVSLAYDGTGDEPPTVVLKNLTFHIAGGEKVGIVGRTGAGKSSLITTLFRLTQPTGRVVIDNIDTADVSLARLRKSLAIIPQEPILFSGTIRRNLDPFSEKSDAELWDAIDKVQLKTKIQSFSSKLDSTVSECGSDFSVGQKQLICLARAILRRSPILVLDEATANIDSFTDSLIQKTIRTEFATNTVITIAHRLNTIQDVDRVMVLDAGSLVQFDSPYELIKQKSGIFYELYSSLNQDVKNEIQKAAEKVYNDKNKQRMI